MATGVSSDPHRVDHATAADAQGAVSQLNLPAPQGIASSGESSLAPVSPLETTRVFSFNSMEKVGDQAGTVYPLLDPNRHSSTSSTSGGLLVSTEEMRKLLENTRVSQAPSTDSLPTPPPPNERKSSNTERGCCADLFLAFWEWLSGWICSFFSRSS